MYESIIAQANLDYNPYCDRPTMIVIKKKKLYKNSYPSKWANFKLFLQEQKSLESSIKLQKKNTIDQFASKCKEIYKKKIQIQLITKKNRQMFKTYNSSSKYSIDKDTYKINEQINKINVRDVLKELIDASKESFDDSKGLLDERRCLIIKDFLFEFRKNNDLMMRLIECANNEQCEILVPFLCHFFYENFYMESTEQEEMLYIIYLLLEKEIDSLYTPSVSTFLEQSFISNFLIEMGNRYEIKHYINIILTNLIMNIEETNITFNSMDILGNKSENIEDVYYDMTEDNDIYNNSFNYNRMETLSKHRNDSIINNFHINNKISVAQNTKNIKNSVFLTENNFTFKGGAISINDIKNNGNYASKIPLEKEINNNLFNGIDERFIREKLENEKDEIMKHFYVRQLRRLQASKNKDLFNGKLYYEKLKKEKKIYKKYVTEFNKGYKLIINFINKLLTNLENNTIVPYSIKVICKFIYQLLKKRFKNISEIQCNILICQYLFDKLIFPVLQNPDINDTGKDMIVSFNTRKSLSTIYDVFKKLVRGELFSINDRDYLVIFNTFIINNYHRLNKIINKIIHVKAPEKLEKLIDKFYENESFVLDKLKREKEEINYNYFKENPSDFMQHTSICFSIQDLSVFSHIVENNKERFEEFQDIMEELPDIVKELEKDKSKSNDYYMIIKDEYDEEVKELLNHEEKKITLEKIKSKEEIYRNIKNCIEYVISNVEIFPNWNWVRENWDTYKTFQFIHSYLTTYNLDSRNYLKNKKGTIPLSWYSLYIINNLKKLKNTTYCLNDFQNLYENLVSEVVIQLKKLRKLNNFLTVNMSTKFILIDHKIKVFNQELKNVKNTELNIKIVQFMENTKIKACLTTVDELYNLSKFISNFHDNFDLKSPNKFILVIRNKKSDCVHKSKLDNKIYLKEKQFIKKSHCKTINQFCIRLAEYHQYICNDIIAGIGQSTPIPQSQKNESHKIKYKQSSSKDVVDIYMSYVENEINESNIFKIYGEDKQQIETDKEKAFRVIWNYILKSLCIKIYENEINEKDKNFRKICQTLSWVKPENLNLDKDAYNSNLFKKVEYHIKKMDNLRTPGGMLNQLGSGVSFINYMFMFMKNEIAGDPDILLPFIIYGIINSKPKRMIFNIKFIKYFINQNQSKGDIGYSLTQAESAIRYIQKEINGKKLKMDEQEFQKRCDETINLKNLNKIKSINDDSEYDEE